MNWSQIEWFQKRRILYALVFALIIIAFAAYPVYKIVSPTPTCSDGRQNGTEVGVDCGGSCALVCSTQVKPLKIVWAKAFRVQEGYYDLGAYVENPNTNAGVKSAPYTLRMLDAEGKTLAEQNGTVEIPPASPLLLFAGNIQATGTPDKVDVIFAGGKDLAWYKSPAIQSVIMTKNQSLKNTDTKPRFDATLVNTDLVNDVGYVALGAVVYDAMRHPVAVSRTFAEGIPKGGEQNIFFTWPNRFTKNPRGGICTTPVDTMLVFDRSGSMDVGGKKPPEPLTTAKNAANTYIDAAELIDKVGVVSFAGDVSNPVDHELSFDHEAVKNTTSAINIVAGSLQYTNLGDALKSAMDELASVHHTKDAKKVIVALTDGVTNRPVDPTNKDKNYAESYAIGQAAAARTAGIQIYTIGLGKSINEVFLRDRIATDPTQYFNAPTAADLQGVYKKISESVCKEESFITEIVITPKAVFTE